MAFDEVIDLFGDYEYNGFLGLTACKFIMEKWIARVEASTGDLLCRQLGSGETHGPGYTASGQRTNDASLVEAYIKASGSKTTSTMSISNIVLPANPTLSEWIMYVILKTDAVSFRLSNLGSVSSPRYDLSSPDNYIASTMTSRGYVTKIGSAKGRNSLKAESSGGLRIPGTGFWY